MKHPLHFSLVAIAIGALMVCGCFTESHRRSQASQRHVDEIDAIDFSIINDRSRWVDPAWLP